MLQLFHGNDREKARKRLNAAIAAFVAPNPDAPVRRVGAEDVSAANLRELASSRGLFSPTSIAVLQDALGHKETQETILGNLALLAASPNAFFLLEGGLQAGILSQVKKHAVVVEACLKKEEKKKPSFSVFSVADALGKKDKKTLWMLYQSALQGGISPEELHPVLVWKVKSMILAQQSQNAAASGLSPFVFARSRQDARHFTNDELRNLSVQLVALYHTARRGTGEMETGLEKTLLRLQDSGARR